VKTLTPVKVLARMSSFLPRQRAYPLPPVRDLPGVLALGQQTQVARLRVRHLAEILPKNLRQYDRIGRWGGEEFIVVLPDTGISEAIAIAERMRTTTAETKISLEQGDHYAVQISLGVASASAYYPPLAKLVHAADLAMYQAKQTGRNRVCSFDQPIE
jgi:diguanylate cyclase (GGDEF)-like protein